MLINEVQAAEITDRENLAVVYMVEALEAIPNKDNIELVHLKDCGYTAICQKGHQVGDLVVFIKYDSVLPRNELFEFMAETKFRVKTKSFTERDEYDNIVKKIYSQGIVLPMNKVHDHVADMENVNFTWFVEGQDVTKHLEVTKYIPPVQGSGSGFGVMASNGEFPTQFVSKTDEMNLASKTRALDELNGKRVYITLKVEGSSLTVMWDDDRDKLMVCSRNNQIGEHETNKFWQAANKYNLKEFMSENRDIVIQAELYSEGIQKNKLGIKGVDIAIFNVSRKSDRTRFNYYELCEFCVNNGLPMVHVCCEIGHFDWDFDKLQAYSDIQRYENGELAEGIVVRPYVPFMSQTLYDLWSFKVINREYKL